MNTENFLKNKWVWIIGGVVLLVIIIASGGEEQSVPTTTQPSTPVYTAENCVHDLAVQYANAVKRDMDNGVPFSDTDVANQLSEYERQKKECYDAKTPIPVSEKKELTSEQKSIRAFLAKELELDDELQRGNDEIVNASSEFDYGVPLPYIIKAELIFENVLKESKALVAPPGGEKVKTYLIEATSNALSGVKKIREGLESYPVDKAKLGQGIELYTKAQMPLARKNAEIEKLKQEAGI